MSCPITHHHDCPSSPSSHIILGLLRCRSLHCCWMPRTFHDCHAPPSRLRVFVAVPLLNDATHLRSVKGTVMRYRHRRLLRCRPFINAAKHHCHALSSSRCISSAAAIVVAISSQTTHSPFLLTLGHVVDVPAANHQTSWWATSCHVPSPTIMIVRRRRPPISSSAFFDAVPFIVAGCHEPSMTVMRRRLHDCASA